MDKKREQMHEFSAAACMVDMARKTVRDGARRNVVNIRLRLGVCTCISPESLRFAFESLTREPPVRGCALQIERVAARGLCRDCGWRGELLDPHRALCPRCSCAPGSSGEGHDKPLKYPLLFRTAQVLLVNKIDLLSGVDFDPALAVRYAKALNPTLTTLQR